MQPHKSFYRKNLPHYQPKGATFFITYRLAGSIPMEIIKQWNAELDVAEKKTTKKEEKIKIYKQHFAKADQELDKSQNEPYWLKDENIAAIVADSLQHCDALYFKLWCFTIMTNHVHVLFTHTNSEVPLYSVLQKHKRHTALKSNQLLSRTGSFWENESYDHVMKTDAEFDRVVLYILNNPVKAGFVSKPSDWKWTWLHPELSSKYNFDVH